MLYVRRKNAECIVVSIKMPAIQERRHTGQNRAAIVGRARKLSQWQLLWSQSLTADVVLKRINKCFSEFAFNVLVFHFCDRSCLHYAFAINSVRIYNFCVREFKAPYIYISLLLSLCVRTVMCLWILGTWPNVRTPCLYDLCFTCVIYSGTRHSRRLCCFGHRTKH